MSASPITAADFPDFNPAADLCTKMQSLLATSEKLQVFFEWAFDSNGNWNEDAIVQIVEASTPIGTTILWPAGSLPSANWLICNGSEVSRTTYATLYSRIGTNYGAGNGTTTFNLPNLVGRFAQGAGTDPLASSGGERTHVLTESELPAHSHVVPTDRFDTTDRNPGGQSYYVPDQGGSTDSDITSGDTGSDSAHENMPPYLALHYIIRVL